MTNNHTLDKWAVIYWTGAVPLRWSHNLISPSWAVANKNLDFLFHRTWVAPAKKRNLLKRKSLRLPLISELWLYLPTVDRETEGRRVSLKSHIWVNVSMEHEAIKFWSNWCQLMSLTTLVCEHRVWVKDSPPLAQFRISILWLL